MGPMCDVRVAEKIQKVDRVKKKFRSEKKKKIYLSGNKVQYESEAVVVNNRENATIIDGNVKPLCTIENIK